MSHTQTPTISVATTRQTVTAPRLPWLLTAVAVSSRQGWLALSRHLRAYRHSPRTQHHARWLQTSGNLAVGLILPLLVFWLWQEAAAHEWLPPFILPSPQLVKETFVDLWVSGELWSNLQISLQRVLWGFISGSLAGLLLGIAMGTSKRVEAYLYPSFKAISQIPALGWIPLLIMLVGIGEAMKILVIAKAALIPVTINTQQSIRNIPRNYLEVAKVYQFSPRQLLGKVILPATVPGVFNGVRYGLTHAWLALVTVEMLASSEGAGFLMVWGRQLAQLDLVMATIVVIGAVGLLFDVTLQQIENRLARWRRLAF